MLHPQMHLTLLYQVLVIQILYRCIDKSILCQGTSNCHVVVVLSAVVFVIWVPLLDWKYLIVPLLSTTFTVFVLLATSPPGGLRTHFIRG
jgi:magnesium-transporting ATPase (P-type)